MQKKIAKVCSTAFFQLRKISKILKHVSRSDAAKLVSALVISHIDYGNSLLAGLPANRLLKKVPKTLLPALSQVLVAKTL